MPCTLGMSSTPGVSPLRTYGTHTIVECVQLLCESVGLVEEEMVGDLVLGVVGVGDGAVHSGGGGGAQRLSYVRRIRAQNR